MKNKIVGLNRAEEGQDDWMSHQNSVHMLAMGEWNVLEWTICVVIGAR